MCSKLCPTERSVNWIQLKCIMYMQNLSPGSYDFQLWTPNLFLTQSKNTIFASLFFYFTPFLAKANPHQKCVKSRNWIISRTSLFHQTVMGIHPYDMTIEAESDYDKKLTLVWFSWKTYDKHMLQNTIHAIWFHTRLHFPFIYSCWPVHTGKHKCQYE